jgi:VCBS repeat-containing protein
VAIADSYGTDEDTALSRTAPGVLGNDTDADGGGTLQAVVASGPAHGTLALNADGSFVYTPALNFHGSDSFTYVATDGTGQSAPATVTITVNAVADDYEFKNLRNAPPPPGATFNAGGAVPMKWAFVSGSRLVDSGQVDHVVTVTGPTPGGPVRTFSNTDPGSSGFRYSASSRSWSFNLQTKDTGGGALPPGAYEVKITPSTPGYGPSPTFQIRLK